MPSDGGADPARPTRGLAPKTADATYDVHGLVTVSVDDAVPSLLRKAIDFQLRWFRADDPKRSLNPRRLSVKPYKVHPDRSGDHVVRFHTGRALPGRLLDYPEERLAIEKTAEGFTIFTETSDLTINLYLQLLLSETKHALIHAGGYVAPSGSGTLLPGAGGVGKTALVQAAVQRGAGRFLGDDLVIVSAQGTCLSFPRALVFKRYHEPTQPVEAWDSLKSFVSVRFRRLFVGLLGGLRRNLPFMGVTKQLMNRLSFGRKVMERIPAGNSDVTQAVRPEDLFGAASIAESGSVDRFVFMSRTTGVRPSAVPLDRALATARTVSIIHHEWSGELRRLTALGANGLVDLPGYFATYREIVSRAIESSACWELRIPESVHVSDLDDELILSAISQAESGLQRPTG